MIDKLEFSDVKQVRKSLIISSTFGIFFKLLVEYSTGYIKFLGFEIPIKNADILPNFISAIIVYFLISLIIRFLDEKFREKYEEDFRTHGFRTEKPFSEVDFNDPEFKKFTYDMVKRPKLKGIRFGILFLDIVFPLLLGILSLSWIYLK